MPASKRLSRILSMLRPGQLLADIGTDHAYVPIEAVRTGLCLQALACDVVPGPLAHAARNIEAAGLEGRIRTRLGNGFAALRDDCPDRIVIAGMGGGLIMQILGEADASRLFGADRDVQLILSPQSEWMEFRTFLADNGYLIRCESMLAEAGKRYLILDVTPGGKLCGDDVLPRHVLRYGDAALYDRESAEVRRAYIRHDRATALAIRKQLRENDAPAAAARRRELEDLVADADAALGEGGNGSL